MEDRSLYLKYVLSGLGLGAAAGLLLGAGTGALSASWAGVQFGAITGLILGALTGSMTGALTVRIAGHTGGVSTGAYTGMLFGALLGGALGIFIPDSFRASVSALGVLVLQVLAQGRFEAAVLLAFLLSCIATVVGAWVGGRIFKPRELNKPA